jgi:hypothetical protein
MEAGAFFTIKELRDIFPRLKSMETRLDRDERAALIKIEKILYNSLSVEEIEAMQDRAQEMSSGEGY